MAEYLIMSEEHWTHRVPEAERANWSPAMWEKYHSAHEKGDVIAVYEDGALGETIDNPRFRGVKVPGEPVNTHRQNIYAEDEKSEDQPGKLIMNRRFNVDIDALVPAGDTIAEVSSEHFAARMYDKKSLVEGL